MTHSSPHLRIPHLRVIDLGTLAYAPAWEKQKQVHDELLNNPDTPPTLLLVEHDPVITISQRKAAPEHLLASQDHLASMGSTTHATDRGGDITYHGPGQLVAYPILRLTDYKLNVGRYMRLLENIVIQTLAHFDIPAHTDAANTGVWVKPNPNTPASKICAMGVRVKRNITLHGLALNVTTNLAHFATIVPCGLSDRSVTSMQQVLENEGRSVPLMDEVKNKLVMTFNEMLPVIGTCDTL